MLPTVWKDGNASFTNIHHWHGWQQFHQCAHPSIPRETERRKDWLKVGNPVHDALKEVALNKSLLKDIGMLAEFIHTGILEMYHGLMAKKYCQKVQHYSYDGMRARTQLAVLDHNHNVGRSNSQTKEGAKKHKFVSPKGSVGWIAKPQYEEKSYAFLNDLMVSLLAHTQMLVCHTPDSSQQWPSPTLLFRMTTYTASRRIVL